MGVVDRDGALVFGVGMDTTDLERGAERAKKALEGVGGTAQGASESLRSSIGGMVTAIQQARATMGILQQSISGLNATMGASGTQAGEQKRRIQELEKALADLQKNYTAVTGAVGDTGDAMDMATRRVAQTTSGVSSLSSSLKSAFGVLGVGAGIAALKQLTGEMVRVRSEMELMESSFSVLVGADKMESFVGGLKQFSVESPLSLTDTTQAAQTLLGFGVEAENVMDILRQLGDVSMGNADRFRSLALVYAQTQSAGRLMGQDLLQYVNAGFNPLQVIAEKTGKSIAQLRDEMSAGGVSAEMVADAFRTVTSEGGKFYGITKKQAEGLAGLKASLDNAITEAFNEMGKSQSGVIATGLKMTTSLVENYDKIGAALATLVAGYGAYKAATIAVSVLETYRSSRVVPDLALRTLGFANATKTLTFAQWAGVKAQTALNAVQMANPYVALTAAVVALGVAIWAFHDSTTAAEHASKALADRTQQLAEEAEAERSSVERLIETIKDETSTRTQKQKALETLQAMYPSVFSGLDAEKIKHLELADAIRAVNVELEKKTGKQRADDITTAQRIFNNMTADESGYDFGSKADREEAKKLLGDSFSGDGFKARERLRAFIEQARKAQREEALTAEKARYNALPTATKLQEKNAQLERLQKRLEQTQSTQSTPFGNSFIKNASQSLTKETLEGQIAKTKAEIKQLEAQASQKPETFDVTYATKKAAWESAKQKLANIEKEKNAYTVTDYQTAKEALETAEKAYKEVGGVTSTKSGTKTKAVGAAHRSAQNAPLPYEEQNATRRATLEAINTELELEAERIALLDEGAQKEEQTRELNHRKALLAIERRTAELIEAEQKAQKKAWERANPDHKEKGLTFSPTTTSRETLSDTAKTELLRRDALASATQEAEQSKAYASLLKKYADYTDKRRAIEAEFQSELETLQTAPESEQRDGVVARLQKAKQKALAEIDSKELADAQGANSLLVSLFEGAEKQSTASIKRIISQTEELLDYLKTTQSEDVTANFGFSADQLRTFQSDADKIKAVMDGVTAKKTELGKRSPLEKFQMGFSDGLSKIKQGGSENVADGIAQIGKTATEFLPTLKEWGEALDEIFSGSDIATSVQTATQIVEGVSSIAQGFAQGGLLGGVQAGISTAVQLATSAIKAQKAHLEALAKIEQSRLALARQYTLALLEQNLQMKEASSVFGEQQISRASNSMSVYTEALSQYRTELSSLSSAQIVTGHKKTGLFGWGKGKDTYSDILSVYPDLLDAEGNLNTERLEAILNTQNMSDETKAYLQNLLDLNEAAEEAMEQLEDYLESTFGTLGDSLMESLANALSDGSVNAWKDFAEAGAEVIESLGEQLAYQLFFADKFQQLQDELTAIYSSGNSSEQIASDAMALVGSFYSGIEGQMETAQAFLDQWREQAENYNLSLWNDTDTSQSSTSGYSTTMSEETGGAMLGRLTGIHEVLLRSADTLEAISLGVTQTSIGAEALRKLYTEGLENQLVMRTDVADISNGMTKLLVHTAHLAPMHALLEGIKKGTDKL